MTYVKKSHTKLYIGIILIAIIAVSGAAVAYSILSVRHYEAGVKAGDTFTYSLKGYADLTGLDASITPGFNDYNNTEYYKITILDVTNKTTVSMQCDWKFFNGTTITSTQTIDIATGLKSDESGFWAIYPTGLTTTDLLRPYGYDGKIVNNTYTETKYASGGRDTCTWHIENQFYDTNDPTQSTLMADYRNIYFDRQTGMLTALANWQMYNNPEKTQTIEWILVDSSVWQV
jgi:hypothetical protein